MIRMKTAAMFGRLTNGKTFEKIALWLWCDALGKVGEVVSVILFWQIQYESFVFYGYFTDHLEYILHLAIIEFGFRRIWRILQIKEGVIHRRRRPRWITPSEICRILHILRKPNSIIALLFIQNISSFLRWFLTIALRFLSAHILWRHLARPRARAH